MAGFDLQSLAAPPAVLQQSQLSSALPTASYGAPSLLDHLKAAFQPNPQGLNGVATSDPGVIGGMLPAGSGAQSFLGRLGDAFLIANGKEPIHRQFAQQQAEGQAEAPMLQNGAFDANGQISDAAHQSLVELAKINPQAAQQMQGQLVSSQLARAQFNRENAVSQADIASKKSEMDAKNVGAARALLASSNASNYPVVKGRAEQYLTARGIDPSILGLPDSYDKDAISSIMLAGVPVTRQFQQQETHDYHQQMIPIQQENADARMKGAGAQGAKAGASISEAGTAGGSLAERTRHDQVMEEIERNKGHGHHVFGGAPSGAPSVGPANMGPANAQSAAISQARAAIAAGAPRAAVLQRLQQMKINPAGL